MEQLKKDLKEIGQDILKRPGHWLLGTITMIAYCALFYFWCLFIV